MPKVSSTTAAPKSEMSNKSVASLFLISLIVTFLLSLYFQYRVFDCKITFLLDSGHYLVTAGGIVNALTLLLANNQPEFARQLPELTSSLLLDGPILPFAGAICLWLSGQPATGCSWYAITAFICLCNAITGGAVSVLLAMLTRSKRLALLGGALWAVYPGTIISSGRFLTEPMATALLLLVTLCSACLCYSSSFQKKHYWLTFIVGMLSSCGFLLKPVLVILWFTLPVVALFLSEAIHKRPTKAVITFFTGLLIAIAPWLIFTRLATGQFALSPQRAPTYNLAKGHDLGADGWSTNPDTPKTVYYANSGDSRFIITDAWKQNPLELANLYMRKVTRTMGFEWNDFRQSVYGLSPDTQNFGHALLLAAAICGVIGLLLQPALSKPAEFIGISSIIAIATHALLYLPFEAITRYGFCAVPFELIAGVYSVKTLTRSWLGVAVYIMSLIACVAAIKLPIFEYMMPLSSALDLAWYETSFRLVVVVVAPTIVYLMIKRNSKIKSWRLSMTASLLIMLVVAPTVCISSFLPEYQSAKISLKQGERIVRSFDLPDSANEKVTDFLVLIDCDKRIDEANVSVNGVFLSTQAISFNKLDSDYYHLFNLLRMFSAITDSSVNDMRQWRVISIPPSILRPGKKNQLSVFSGPSGIDIFCDRVNPSANKVFLPNRGFSSGFYSNGAEGSDSRLPDITPTEIQASKTKIFKNSPTAMIQSERLLPPLLLPRLYLLSSQNTRPIKEQQNRDCKRVALACKHLTPLPVTDFDSTLWQGSPVNDRALNINRYTFKLARSLTIEKTLPTAITKCPLIELRLTGSIKSTGRAKKLGILVTAISSKPHGPFMILPNNRPYIDCTNQWQKFEVADILNLEGLPNAKIAVSLLPGRWEQFIQYGIDRTVGSFQVKDLELSLEPSSLPVLTKAKTIKY